MSSDLRIVLVNTSHPGNIGAVARAMKNMRLERLYLVSPQAFPSAEATARASGADDVLARAVICDTLEEAIGDCALVVGASARPRTIECAALAPGELARGVAVGRSEGSAAVVFGREHSGLSNAELDRCHYQLHIPSNPDFPSLNLATAVQIVCYELFLASGGAAPEAEADNGQPAATAGEMERFYEHLEQVLVEIEFLDPRRPRHLMRRLRRLYNRANADRNEINILRGILTAVQKKTGGAHRGGA